MVQALECLDTHVDTCVYIKQITLKHLGVCHVKYTMGDYSFGSVPGITRVSKISLFLQHENDTHSYIQNTKAIHIISYILFNY